MAPKRRIAFLFVIGSLLAFVISCLGMPIVPLQHPPRSLSMAVEIQCPHYPVSGKSPINLHAYIGGTSDAERLKDVKFKWSASDGSILSGQGTRTIGLTPAQMNGTSRIDVNLEVEGGPPELTFTTACALIVNPQCSSAPVIDQYSVISLDEERKHLDQFAERLKTGPAQSIAYIVSYAGARACINESDWRAKRAQKYLVENYSIPRSRVVTVEGGFKENWTVELFVQDSGDCGPLPKPTLINTQAEVVVQGFCDPKNPLP